MSADNKQVDRLFADDLGDGLLGISVSNMRHVLTAMEPVRQPLYFLLGATMRLLIDSAEKHGINRARR